MHKLFFSFLFLLLLPRLSKAQMDVAYSGTWGFMVQSGTNWFFGDVGGRPGIGQKGLKDWNLKGTSGYFSASVYRNFTERLALRLEASAGRIQSADNYLPADDNSGRRQRNLSFRSPIYEVAAGVQLNYRFFENYAVDNEPLKKRFFPHLFVGLGAFYSDPKTYFNDKWVQLRPLRTEGQGMAEYPDRTPYKKVNLFVPVALGLNYYFNEGLGVHLECMWRKSSSDYVDDVSTTYIDPVLFDKYLSPEQAQLAHALHDRSGEINGGRNSGSIGEIRGKPDSDSWVSLSLGVTYNLWKRKYY